MPAQFFHHACQDFITKAFVLGLTSPQACHSPSLCKWHANQQRAHHLRVTCHHVHLDTWIKCAGFTAGCTMVCNHWGQSQ